MYTYPLKNYQDIAQKYENILQLQQRVDLVVSFLELTKNIETKPYTENYLESIPAIHLGRGNGNSLGISKFILDNNKESILVVTHNRYQYLDFQDAPSNVLNTNTNIVTPTTKLAGYQFDRIIFEGLSIKEIKDCLSTASSLATKIVLVG